MSDDHRHVRVEGVLRWWGCSCAFTASHVAAGRTNHSFSSRHSCLKNQSSCQMSSILVFVRVPFALTNIGFTEWKFMPLKATKLLKRYRNSRVTYLGASSGRSVRDAVVRPFCSRLFISFDGRASGRSFWEGILSGSENCSQQPAQTEGVDE